MISLRAAILADLASVVARTRALNAVEQIEIADDALVAAATRLLSDSSLGQVWVIERDGTAIGQAVVTYGFDLEFGGRDSFLTELWVDADARGQGAATATLRLLEAELQRRDVRALHLGVRPENPARRLYERSGFVAVPRVLMTRVFDSPGFAGARSNA
jgi:ribosomal protein S18 acetylase RimI-like enzyme